MIFPRFMTSVIRASHRISLIAGYQGISRPPRRAVIAWTAGAAASTSAAFMYSFGSVLASSKPVSSADAEMQVNNSNRMRYRVESLFTRIQREVCKKLEELDGHSHFHLDRWEQPSQGGGVIVMSDSVMSDGKVFEKAGVDVSVVKGTLTTGAMQQIAALRGKTFNDPAPEYFVCAVSSVIHPRNPHVPTVHFNYRYFEVQEKDGSRHWWFGGVTDLTPYFLDESDVKHFHGTLKKACDGHSKSYYEKFKKWCDDYFYIPHRGEHRGVGGIFFDDICEPSFEDAFEFVKSCGESIIPAYEPIVKKHKNDSYTHDDREWQLLRRGRYVEFNLVHDRGTKFGLFTPGVRIESVLMSLPKYAKWQYCHEPAANSRESKMMAVLKNPKVWA